MSIELVIYILANNLYEADMPWLLRNYSGFSNEVKEAVLQVASNMVEQIASTYSDDVDNALLDLLFRSERVDFEGKIQLLEKTANSMSKEELCIVLGHLDADKILDMYVENRRHEIDGVYEQKMKDDPDQNLSYAFIKTTDFPSMPDEIYILLAKKKDEFYAHICPFDNILVRKGDEHEILGRYTAAEAVGDDCLLSYRKYVKDEGIID